MPDAGSLESSDEAEVATTAKKGVPNAGSLESRDEAKEATTAKKGVPMTLNKARKV